MKIILLPLVCASVLLAQDKISDIAPKATELTVEQKLSFQTALAEYYKQIAIGNSLQVQFAQNQEMQKKAATVLHASCDGDIVGLDKGTAECKPKLLEVKTTEKSK